MKYFFALITFLFFCFGFGVIFIAIANATGLAFSHHFNDAAVILVLLPAALVTYLFFKD